MLDYKRLTETGELATLHKVKAFGEINGVAKSSFLGSREVNVVGTRGIEGETAQRFVLEIVGTRGVVCFHGLLSIGCISVLMGEL